MRSLILGLAVSALLLTACSQVPRPGSSPESHYLYDLCRSGAPIPQISDAQLVKAGNAMCDVLDTVRGSLHPTDNRDQITLAAATVAAGGLNPRYTHASASAALSDLCPDSAVDQ